MQLRKPFINSLPFFLFLLTFTNKSLAQSTTSKIKDTAASLYYFVENAIEVSSSNAGGKASESNGLQKFTADKAYTSSQKNNFFLIPFILSKVTEHTCYKNPMDRKKKSGVFPCMFLKIDINTFNNNIEYQFYLQKIVKEKDTVDLKSSSFFINPDDPGYRDIISREVQRIFEGYGGTNERPIAKIRLAGGSIQGSKIYRSNLDTIVLDGSSSADYETPKKLLTYKWEVNKKDKSYKSNEPAYLADFKFENSLQKMVISDTGTYNFYLEVYDGVTRSKKDSIQIICVLEKPVLELTRNCFEITSQRNFLSFREKKIYALENIVGYKVSARENKTHLHFKHISSSNKSGKLFLDNKSDITDKSAFKIQGLNDVKFDTILDNKLDEIRFCLKNGILPGKHKYIVYTDFEGVKSNVDTVTVSYREKSSVSVTAGVDRYQVSQGTDYFNGYNLDILKLGLRGYITQRFYGDLNFGVAVNAKSIGGIKNQNININTLMGELSYDIWPLKLSKMHSSEVPFYISPFAAYYQIILLDKTTSQMIRQYGGGGKIRVQLFAKKPKMGVVYVELEVGGYTQMVNNPYKTGFGGINLIYGLWNY